MSVQKQYMRKTGVLIGFLMVFGLFSAGVMAQGVINVILNDTDIINDTYVDSDNPATPFWNQANLVSKNTSAGAYEYVYLSIDTSSIPDTATIHNAEIWLYANTCGGNPGTDYCNMSAHHVYTDALNYGAVTWNTQPCGTDFDNATACNRTYETIQPKPCNDYCLSGWSLWNMTESFQQDIAVDNIFTIGFLQVRANANGGSVTFDSSTSGTAWRRPMLNVNYSDYYVTDTCRDINVSGTYTLSNDINATRDNCIDIQVSNVVLDLNGHDINGWLTGFDTAIDISGNSTSNIENVTVQNGRILYFSSDVQPSLRSWYGAGIGLTGLLFYGNEWGIDMRYQSNSSHITRSVITECNVTASGTYGLYAGLTYGLDILENNFDNINYDMYLVSYEQGFINETVVGNIPVNSTYCTDELTEWWGIPYTATTCVFTASYNGASYGIYCQDCLNNTFVQNHVYGSIRDFYLTGDSWGNRYYFNNFYAKPSLFNGLYLTATTLDNYGCHNWGTIIDFGSNNLFELVCAEEYSGAICTTGYFCIDSETLGFVNSACGYDNTTYCNSGCVSQGNTSYCQGATGQQQATDSFLNLGSYVGGFVWIDYLFTPFMLVTLMLLGVASYIASRFRESAGTIFIVVLVVGALAFSYLGVYPPSVAYIITLFLIVGAVSEIMARRNGGGG